MAPSPSISQSPNLSSCTWSQDTAVAQGQVQQTGPAGQCRGEATGDVAQRRPNTPGLLGRKGSPHLHILSGQRPPRRCLGYQTLPAKPTLSLKILPRGSRCLSPKKTRSLRKKYRGPGSTWRSQPLGYQGMLAVGTGSALAPLVCCVGETFLPCLGRQLGLAP